jgi:glycosyltransferase involved in cell wall biosynthesis
MNILTISNYFPEHYGGIEFVALNLVSEWREHNTVHWMASDLLTCPHTCEPDDIPIPAINFTEEKLGFPYPIPLPSAIHQIIEQVQWCDLVHIHDCLYLTNVIGFFASRWYRKPLIVTQHVGFVPYSSGIKNLLQHLAYKTIGKLVLKNAKQVVFINQRVKSWFERRIRFQQPALLIPNGVDHTKFFPNDDNHRKQIRHQLGFFDNQTVALFVGRFTEKKGLHFVHQIALLRPNLFWVIIGEGDIKPQDWNLPNIHVLAPQSQSMLRKYYFAADLFILPSVGEGFPLVVQEALSCGLPVAVSQETTTYLPDAPLIPLDISAISSIMDSLDILLTNQNQLIQLRKKSSEYAHRWDWQKAANEYENIFYKALKEFTK